MVVGVALAGVIALTGWIVGGSPASVSIEGAHVAVAERGEPVLIEVMSGDTAAAIATRLADAGVIDDASSFRLLARVTGAERRLEAGEYEFARGTSVLDALTRINAGLTAGRLVAVPEGLRMEEVAALLERRGIVPARDFLGAAATYPGPTAPTAPLLSSRPPGLSLEGFLFPATYSFSRKATPAEIVDTMVKALDERLTPQLREEARQKGLSVYQVVTLASIVEREVVRPEEAPLIAGVFLNRLRLDMPLQADPTVQYSVAAPGAATAGGGLWKHDLTAQDLQSASPYNTYARKGLPPGPIASPGIDAILAVIRPASTDYLFFVARPDGSHVFATTFEEHERNVARYQR